MGRFVASRANAGQGRAALRPVLVAMLLVGALATMPGGPVPAALAVAGPDRAASQGDDAPTPAAPGPRFNPVSSTDDTVVRPDDTAGDAATGAPAATVSGLPASGIGSTVPADDDVRRWTHAAMLALGLNALILAAVAIRSIGRRRI